MRSALLTAVLAGVAVQAAPSPMAARYDHEKRLRFRVDGSFHLSVFSDLHFGEKQGTAEGHKRDEKTITVMNNVLDADPTDLVVLNGDLITGDASTTKNMSGYVDTIVQPMVKRGIWWASTYGNHDSSQNLDPRNILEHETRHPGALSASMAKGKEVGVTNYVLQVYPSNCTHSGKDTKTDRSGKPCVPNMLLWFFDSRGGEWFGRKGKDGKPVPRPNWVDLDVVRWFRKTSVDIRRQHGRVIPSLAFVHIPTNATNFVQGEVRGDDNPGINDETPVSQQAQYWCKDGTWGGKGNAKCRWGEQDVPFIRALSGTEGLMAVFSGHDHGNTWCRRWHEVIDSENIQGNNINLCFGQHTGYGGYGDWVRGGRHIVVTEELLKKFAIDTYIRLETKVAVGRVSLNSTYNRDRYPITKNDKTFL
ncbi:metallophosphoesterase [Purpureocillium lilacinum]|uniref:Metallophosphoesterase n=1 Tax=Purpureocillium lilacinum TaxID=33203 RepID=A0A179HJ77_PURLI|nr:metallophosphoesterase [Purpureocillium lilacinum]OAQ89688.1 metallophosphoesterase [Purpureocillium lilacinum]